jgi:hypothetical protein
MRGTRGGENPGCSRSARRGGGSPTTKQWSPPEPEPAGGGAMPGFVGVSEGVLDMPGGFSGIAGTPVSPSAAAAQLPADLVPSPQRARAVTPTLL